MPAALACLPARAHCARRLQDLSCGNILVRGDGTLVFADFGYSWMEREKDRK